MPNSDFENFARTVNDMDDHYPKGRSRCFDIGVWGGCGEDCGALHDGECEIIVDVIEEYRIE
jgi:hypothetical protein